MNSASQLNQFWTDIYYQLRYKHDDSITHIGVRILQMIEKEPFVTIQSIAAGIGVSANTASEHVSRLHKKGVLEKTRSKQDERKMELTLTAKGKEQLHQHTQLDEEKLTQLLQQASPEERNMIIQGFQTLNQLISQSKKELRK